MTQLSGSNQSVSLGPGYALRTPGFRGTAEMRPAAPAGSRSAMRGAEAFGGALDEALANTNVTEVRQIDMTLQPLPGAAGAGRSMRSADAPATVELEVPDAGPDSGQLVLAIDDSGAIQWIFPEQRAAAGAARGAGGVIFRIPVIVGAPPADAARSRSLFGAIGRRLLKVLVYPITDPIVGAITDAFARRWEEKNRPYRMRDFTPDNYTLRDAKTLSAADVATLAAGQPVLLFVHGTFSTANGGFGGIARDTIVELHRRYGGRVIAFEHPTLADDPGANVRTLLASLPSGGLDVDIVCHSRGGLVSRLLAEAPAALGIDAGKVRVRRIVLGAVPNAGTILTDADHMVDMIDRLTTAVSLAPGGVVTEMLEAMITALKVIGHAGLKSLAGLASMQPQGAFLKSLNGPGSKPADYFALAANFEPTDRGLRAVVTGAIDGAVDEIFGEANNDLVVPTDGVFAENGNARFPVPDGKRLVYGAADGVMHTNIFDQARSSERLLAWLT